MAYFSSARYCDSGSLEVIRCAPRTAVSACVIRSRDARALQYFRRRAALLRDQREQDVLGGDVLVLHLAGLFFGRVEDLQRALREVSPLAAVHLGDLAQLVFQALLDETRLGADALEQGRDQPVLLPEQGSEKVLREDFLVIAFAGDRLGLLKGLLRLDGKLVEFHGLQRNAATQCGKVRAKECFRPVRYVFRIARSSNQRSCFVCRFIQNSGVVSKNRASKRAVSGVTPRLPLMSELMR